MVDVNNIIDNLKNISILCLRIGGGGLCLLLIVGAVLRWVAPPDKDKEIRKDIRARRLNRLAAFAAVILCVICLSAIVRTLGYTPVSEAGDGTGENIAATSGMGTFVDIFSLMTKLLLLGSVMASVVVLILVIVLFLGHGLTAIFAAGIQETESLNQALENIGKRLTAIMRSNILIAVITWGILALFITLPFLMGTNENGSLAETWKNGVEVIAKFGDSEGNGDGEENNPLDSNNSGQGTEESEKANSEQVSSTISGDTSEEKKADSNDEFLQSLIKYILLTIIVIGVTFSVFRLLYSIIWRIFTEEKTHDFIREYSVAIGVLSVGVAMLWTLRDNMDLLHKPGKLFWEFLKSFVMVMLIVALIILTLEIIRLLLDMREKLIRQEARFLFVALVGEISLLLLSAVNSIYEGLNHAMGNPDNSALEEALDMINEKIVWTMKKHLTVSREYKRTFSGFSETVSGVDDEEDC